MNNLDGIDEDLGVHPLLLSLVNWTGMVFDISSIQSRFLKSCN